MTQAQLVPSQAAAVAPRDAGTSPTAITAMLTLAIEKGVDVAALEKLVALHERVSDRAAAVEFAEAMSAFQNECPPISKTSEAKITSGSGGQYSYRYAELDEIARTVRPLCHKHGLSYSWDSLMEGEKLTCTCIVRHVNGHQITAHFTAPTESKAGMSSQQKHAAALTYARRQSLIQALGLTTCDPDMDGGESECIGPEEIGWIEDEIRALGANREAFLSKIAGVASMQDIQQRDMPKVRAALAAKARQVGK